jgi:putative transcriptional regulator
MIQIRLAVLRAEKGLSQRQVAEMAGLRPDTVSALERGTSGGIKFETLERLCNALNCSPNDLLRIEPGDIVHEVPVLGGPSEDAIIRQRLMAERKTVDGPSFLAALLGKPVSE